SVECALVGKYGNGAWQNRSSYYFNCGPNRAENAPPSNPLYDRGVLPLVEALDLKDWFNRECRLQTSRGKCWSIVGTCASRAIKQASAGRPVCVGRLECSLRLFAEDFLKHFERLLDLGRVFFNLLDDFLDVGVGDGDPCLAHFGDNHIRKLLVLFPSDHDR